MWLAPKTTNCSQKMKRSLLDYLTASTSMHGIKFLTNAKVNKILRIFWCFTLIGSISVFLVYGRILFIRLSVEPEINVRIRLKPMSQIPFPAVTICDSMLAKENVTNFSHFHKLYRLQMHTDLRIEELNYLAAYLHVCAPHLPFDDADFPNRTETDVVKLLNANSFATDEILPMCGFRMMFVDRCSRIFNRVLTDFGFCQSANMLGFGTLFNEGVVSRDFECYRRKNIARTWSGSELVDDENETAIWTLDGQYSEENEEIPKRASKRNSLAIYMAYNFSLDLNFCATYGRIFKVIFHLPNELPTAFHDDCSVEFGNQKMIKLTATSYRSDESLRGFSPKMRRCYFEGERRLKFFKSYTKKLCDLECLTNFTLAACGCVKFSMPREETTRVCNIGENQCYYEAMLTWPANYTSDSACNCYETCNDIKYGVSYEDDAVFDDYHGISKDYDFDTPIMTHLRLMFRTHLVEEHERYAGYKIQNFVADMGGLLGLFLGGSVLSIAEVIFFIIHWISESREIRRTDNSSTDKSLLQVISISDSNHLKERQRQEFERNDGILEGRLVQLEQRIDDLQIQYNVEILSTILAYRKTTN